MFSFSGFGFPGENMGMRMMGMTSFKHTYRCYPVSFMEGKDRSDLESGGKIIMPPSALDALTRLNIQYPMLFKLTNEGEQKSTHCGVLEFVADEGKIYIPYWMMTNLLLQEGGLVQLESVSLQVATFAKFQPQSVDFLDISNPKAVLERALRSFACLSQGDVVAITYNNKRYELCVLETKPGPAVSIIECDMNVDFAPPVGYKEPERQPMQQDLESDDEIDYSAIKHPTNGFQVFSDQGNRLDGKNEKIKSVSPTVQHFNKTRGIPNYDYKRGKITFIRNGRQKESNDSEKHHPFEAFQGQGQNLKSKSSRK